VGDEKALTCGWCGARLPASRAGVRRYCQAAHRQAAFRARQVKARRLATALNPQVAMVYIAEDLAARLEALTPSTRVIPGVCISGWGFHVDPIDLEGGEENWKVLGPGSPIRPTTRYRPRSLAVAREPGRLIGGLAGPAPSPRF